MGSRGNPLAGKRVLVTRPRAQADDLCDRLVALGMVPIIFPTIDIAPPEDTTVLDEAARNLAMFDWVVFTSVNGVASFFERLRAVGRDRTSFDGVRVVAIGPATAGALRERGVDPQATPDEYVADRIPDLLGDVNGQRIQLPRADIAREALAVELRRRGAVVREVVAYRTVIGQPGAEAWAELRRGVDVLTFTSSSTVRYFYRLVREEKDFTPDAALVVCIGPITAQTAREAGLHVDAVAHEYTTGGLVQAVCELLVRQAEEKEKSHG